MRLISNILFVLLFASSGFGWEYRSGDTIGGKVVEFDFSEKTLNFDDPVIGEIRRVSFNDLSFRSQQKLLFSPIYHESFPKETMWPREKRNLLLISIAIVAVPLFLGFWFSGMLIANKLNPFLALFGFAGSWVVGTIFVFIYLVLASRFEGSPHLFWVGYAVGGIFLSIYISAVYACSTWRGFAIFVSHLFTGTCIGLLILLGAEILLSPEKHHDLWNARIFLPVGLSQPD